MSCSEGICSICHHDDAVEIDYDVYKVIRAKLLSE